MKWKWQCNYSDFLFRPPACSIPVVSTEKQNQTPSMLKVPILHWNDVYRVNPQKISPTSSETIDVTQFAAMLDDIRDRWAIRSDGKREGLALFSGDVFSPSLESSVTRGSHMVSYNHSTINGGLLNRPELCPTGSCHE